MNCGELEIVKDPLYLQPKRAHVEKVQVCTSVGMKSRDKPRALVRMAPPVLLVLFWSLCPWCLLSFRALDESLFSYCLRRAENQGSTTKKKKI